MTSNPRHGSPPRLMAHQPIRSPTTQECAARVHRPESVSVCGLSWPDGVVPVAVKRGGPKIEGGHLGIGHPDALGIGAAVEAALDGEAGAGRGAGDHLDDHLVGEQGLAAPVLGDEGEQPMLDPVLPDAVVRAQALSTARRPTVTKPEISETFAVLFVVQQEVEPVFAAALMPSSLCSASWT